MRDYRDAKAMAQTLRSGLKAQAIDISHSNALELIARTLGFRDWQVLAAKIESQRVARKLVHPQSGSASASNTLHCSFCGKTQHEVSKLIAGPNVFICDACIGLCNDVVDDQHLLESAGALEALDAKSAEQLSELKAKARTRIAHGRQLLEQIETVRRRTGRAQPGAPGRSDPQSAFILSRSPQERAAYSAALKASVAAIERVAEKADRLLAERGHLPGSA
jgi:hypothetical protein